MDSSRSYIGCPCEVEKLRALNDKLNAKVVEQVNETQELVMLNNFARETNECHFKKCLQERYLVPGEDLDVGVYRVPEGRNSCFQLIYLDYISRMSDIASWRWVLEDLSKRLEEAIGSLKYEHNALRVVGQRVQGEIDEHSQEGSRPGALSPMSDTVEQAIVEEYNFLRDQKKKFEKLILELEKQVNAMQKTKKRIQTDILHKNRALSVEESCASINVNSCKLDSKRKKKRGSPVSRWENRCSFLKRAGLRALSSSIITRQQVRGARVHLSIAAQAYAARVDSALRRRLHSNKLKLQDLKWQKEEAIRDYKSLQEELETTEQNLIETMEQERLVEARRSDRFLRPARELTKDDVDKNLKDELGRLRNFSKQLRTNLERITSLQNHLTDSLTRIDCYADDLIQVISLDEERFTSRGGDSPECSCENSGPTPNIPSSHPPSSHSASSDRLVAIKEEDEDDYPFDN